FRQDTFAQRTGLADARIAEERARLNLEYTDIRAPFAGVVSGFAVVKGENISVGQALCNITDDSELEAVVNVLEADLGDLTEGRAALVGVPAVDDTIRATVDVISPTLDETSRTCQVIIRFPNTERKYRPGMFARAEMAARIHTDRLLVPREAVLTRDDRTLVFKVTPEPRAQWLYVDTGLENSEWVEILKVHSGGTLAAGDKVVVSDHLTLAHEAKLDVRRTVPVSDRWAFATEEMD
ncbi:efflux RND transporter periplasmic adaptor subunit, partial [bacterium]|nr:efflux RND transporter periplasmic adaptor subunit [bacterium]